MPTHIHILINTLPSLVICLSGLSYAIENQYVTGEDEKSTVDSSLAYQLPHQTIFDETDKKSGGFYEFGEVVVTALRFAPSLRESPSFVTVLSNEQLRRGSAISLAGAISSVPGVHVKDYGGFSGLKTISQRGLGAEHTLVLLNGMRVSSFQNGLVDLGLFPLEDMHQIEVLHGGQSASHGSEAIGGVVNLITQPQDDPIAASLESVFGSFGYQRIRASGGALMGDIGIRANIASERGREDFPFLFRNGPYVEEVIRTNADFTSRYGTLEVSSGIGGRSHLLSFARAYQSERGVGGAVLSPSSSSRARQSDEDYLLQFSLRSDLGREVPLNVGGQIHSAYQRYQDPDLSTGMIQGLDTYFRNNDYRGSANLLIPIAEEYDITLGAELALTTASGTSMGEEFHRWQAGSFLAGKFVVLRQTLGLEHLVVYPSIRLDGFSGVSPAWSPQLAIMARFAETQGEISLAPYVRASASRNFRVPTFNELYYQGGGGIGNPALRPESARGFEAGGGVTARILGTHNFDFIYFETQMTDRIVWVAAGSFGVIPQNIRSVISTGFELSWSWDPFNGPVSLRMGYANISSRKTSKESDQDPNVNTSLVYVPGETANASFGWSVPIEAIMIHRLKGEVAYRFVGLRYTSEDNRGSLPAYQLLDLGFEVQWGLDDLDLHTRIDVMNILNEEYQVILGYPMPMRSVRLTFSVGY